MTFQNNIWNLMKLFITALMWASTRQYSKIVKILLEHKGIDVNAKNV